MKRVIGFGICPDLHAMTDMGLANGERKAQGYTYSLPHTYNAECYAAECTRKGHCLIAKLQTVKSPLSD